MVDKTSRAVVLSNISNTRKSVSADFQTPRSRLEKREAAEFFDLVPVQLVLLKTLEMNLSHFSISDLHAENVEPPCIAQSSKRHYHKKALINCFNYLAC